MDKQVHLIAAMSDNRVIGRKNSLPWHYSSDLQKFKAITSGGTIIMGRKTFESIGKPLPLRENIVLSASGFKSPEGVKVFSSLEEAVEKAGNEQVYIIGGESIYRQAFEKMGARINRVYLTHIRKQFEGDAFFPDVPDSFKQTECQRIMEKDGTRIDFLILENTAAQAAK